MIDPGSFLEPFYLFLLLASLGDIVVERSGVLNLGIDGFIAFAIALSYTATLALDSASSLAIAVVSGLLFALLVAVFVNLLHSSHVLTGLVLNMVFYGLSAIVGTVGQNIASERNLPRTLASPVIIEWYHVAVATVISVALVWILLYRTRLGTSIRACGYNPRAADHLGVKVWRVRLYALLIGYTVISLGSYVFMLFYQKTWSPYRGVGFGFLALALAMSSLWHPVIVVPIAAVFGFLMRNLYVFQLSYGIPEQILYMTPYIAAIAFVTAVSASPLGKRLPIPRALGEIYFREERAA